MTQTEIEYRLAKSGLHPDDLQEIGRIFECLTDSRKLEVLDTWETIVARIKTRRAIIEEERLVLTLDPLNALTEGYQTLITEMRAYQSSMVSEAQTNN